MHFYFILEYIVSGKVTRFSSFNPTDITCPSTTECYLIGTSSTSPAIYQYNSGVFTAITVPSSITSLESISCSSTSQCVATGKASGSVAIIETTNSTTWSQLTVPSGFTDLNSISCPTTTNCYGSMNLLTFMDTAYS